MSSITATFSASETPTSNGVSITVATPPVITSSSTLETSTHSVASANSASRTASKRSLLTHTKDGKVLSEKKLRRLEKNRLSARECRRRKREATENLEREIYVLEGENLRLRLQLQVSFNLLCTCQRSLPYFFIVSLGSFSCE